MYLPRNLLYNHFISFYLILSNSILSHFIQLHFISFAILSGFLSSGGIFTTRPLLFIRSNSAVTLRVYRATEVWVYYCRAMLT